MVERSTSARLFDLRAEHKAEQREGKRFVLRVADLRTRGSESGAGPRFGDSLKWRHDPTLGERWGVPPDVPADAVNWALQNILLYSMPVRDVLDSSLTAAPCLCCYNTHLQSRADGAGAAILEITRYFSAASQSSSSAFYRTLAALVRDITPREEAAIKASFVAYSRGIRPTAQLDACKSLNAIAGVCAIAPPCNPSVLWVYSTPLGRRLLRYMTKACKAISVITKVSLMTEDARNLPQFPQRMYVFSATGKIESPEKFFQAVVEGGARLLVRSRTGPRPRRTPDRMSPTRPADGQTAPPPDTRPQSTSGSRKAGR